MEEYFVPVAGGTRCAGDDSLTSRVPAAPDVTEGLFIQAGYFRLGSGPAVERIRNQTYKAVGS